MCGCYTCRTVCPQGHEEGTVGDPIVAKLYGGDDADDDLAKMLGIDMNDPMQALACHLVNEDAQYHRALVAMRKAKGLTQAEVAEAMGISQSVVHQFEREGGDPKMSTLRRYALAVGAQVHHYVLTAAPRPTQEELRAIDWKTEDDT